MDYKQFYVELKQCRERLQNELEVLLKLNAQWQRHNPLPIDVEDPLGDDLYAVYKDCRRSVQKIPSWDWDIDTNGNLTPGDGPKKFEKYAQSIKRRINNQ